MSLEPNRKIVRPEDHNPETWLVYQDEDGGDLWVRNSRGTWASIDYVGEVILHHGETWDSIVLNYGPVRIVDRVGSDGEINDLSTADYK